MNNYEDELSYITFILGYDLLHDIIMKSKYRECDYTYDICSSISKLFLKSEEYKNLKYSTYEMLEYWLRINKEMIEKEYFGDDE